MAKKIKINGPIISSGAKWIYNLFGIPATCAADVSKVIDAIDPKDSDKDLEISINSGGGSVSEGSEIYTILRTYAEKAGAKIYGYITGMAASAASVIAMACNILNISPTGEIMVHNASTYAGGDHRVMTNASEMLKSTDEGICNAYILKTGMTRNELLDLMSKTTWMNAQQALKMKFVDKIMFDEGNQLVASASPIGELIPQQIIDKMRELLATSGSIPDMGSYKLEIMNQKGDGPMDLQAILANLPEDQRKIVQDAINTAIATAKAEVKAEMETTFGTERTNLQNTINALKQAAPTTAKSEDDILANVDPKIKALVDAARVSEAAAKAEVERLKDEKELAKFTTQAASYTKLPIDAKVFGPIFKNFAKADNEGYVKLTSLLTAANNCIENGKLFDTKGNDNHNNGDLSAWDTIQQRIKDAMTADSKLSRQEAMTNVFKADPELYNRYKDEMYSGEDTSNEE